ncbi:MAG TPA: GNAT family protein, partial [Gillisia sp.]|nr:GNAT family protein [Gillisia sp.]
KQIKTPVEKKVAYALIWEVDNIPVGHSNINRIIYGTEAYMHLHLWKSDWRKKGLGTQLVIKSLPFYFKMFKLKNLICEPRAINPGPNKTLEKVGFELERTYVTIPGSINFEQEVNSWKMSGSRFKDLYDQS